MSRRSVDDSGFESPGPPQQSLPRGCSKGSDDPGVIAATTGKPGVRSPASRPIRRIFQRGCRTAHRSWPTAVPSPSREAKRRISLPPAPSTTRRSGGPLPPGIFGLRLVLDRLHRALQRGFQSLLFNVSAASVSGRGKRLPGRRGAEAGGGPHTGPSGSMRPNYPVARGLGRPGVYAGG